MTTTMLETKRLSTDAFSAAQSYIETKARPLEKARFKRHFQNGSVDEVLHALAAYQNADGGFGNALEPDLRAPESSAICTSVAFQILREVQPLSTGVAIQPPQPELVEGVGGLRQAQAAADRLSTDVAAQSMIERGITYLLQTLDREKLHWRIIPLEAANSPRAPWWHEDGRAASFDKFSLNPTAEILGYLYEYQRLVPSEIIERLSTRIVTQVDELKSIEMHDLFCCLSLLRTKELPAEFATQLQRSLRRLIDNAVGVDPDQWQAYGLQPLGVVDAPDSPFMAGLEAAVAANLDFEIAAQAEDGSWSPSWTWGDAYPAVWPQARSEWAGVITLGKLRQLYRFGRI